MFKLFDWLGLKKKMWFFLLMFMLLGMLNLLQFGAFNFRVYLI